ncbi:MAG: adenine phosphoribosyltransferase [Pseudomonadota bacterium]
MSDDTLKLDLRDQIRDVPDFPKPGILFKDITPLLLNPSAFRLCIEKLCAPWYHTEPDVIVGIEARGFIFGAAMAVQMGIPFVPIRKSGKLPWKTRSRTYSLEYGEDTVEIHEDAVQPGQKVLLVDDLLATGGTMGAAIRLVQDLGGEVIEALFVVELKDLAGRDKLPDVPVRSILTY